MASNSRILVAVSRFYRCRSEFHHAAAAHVVHTLRRVRALRDAAPAAAMVCPRRLRNGANTHGDGRHKSPSGLHRRETHRRAFPFKVSSTEDIYLAH